MQLTRLMAGVGRRGTEEAERKETRSGHEPDQDQDWRLLGWTAGQVRKVGDRKDRSRFFCTAGGAVGWLRCLHEDPGSAALAKPKCKGKVPSVTWYQHPTRRPASGFCTSAVWSTCGLRRGGVGQNRNKRPRVPLLGTPTLVKTTHDPAGWHNTRNGSPVVDNGALTECQKRGSQGLGRLRSSLDTLSCPCRHEVIRPGLLQTDFCESLCGTFFRCQ